MVMYFYITNVTIFDVNKAALWLKEKREGRNLSFRELGEKVGLSHGTIANAEDGVATEKTWIMLAEFFKEDPQLVLFWAKKVDESPVPVDEWAEKIYRRLERLPPELRDIAEAMIDVLYEKEKATKSQSKKKNRV